MKTFHYDMAGVVTGIIEDYPDGRARLKVYAYSFSGPVEVHNKFHKNRRAALAAWYRLIN